ADRDVFYLQNHIVRLQSGGGGRSVRKHLLDQGPLDAVETELERVVGLEGENELHAEVAALDRPLLKELVHDALDEVGRDAEGDAAVGPVVRGDGGVDADAFAIRVDERSAGGAGIDGGIGLKKFFDANGVAQRHLAAIAGADDAVADRLVESKRTAD